MKQFVIIGNSAAGIAAVEAIRQRDEGSKIIVISDENYPSYCRCLISYYLAGDVKEDKLSLRPESFYKENNVELILNKKVVRVDPKKNRIVLDDKTQNSYDCLLIATGAHSRMPDIKGIKKTGVFGFRTIKDAKAIEGLLPVTHAVCILGGGLVGLKSAYALKKRKIDVKVIVKSNQILSQVLDFTAASLVQKRLEGSDIEIILGHDVQEVIGEGEIKAIKLNSGKALECSLIVVGRGVEPNIDLIKDTEIKTNTGIIVNNFLQSSVSNIFAAGDVCESFDLTGNEFYTNALWSVAVEQGLIAGSNMTGANINYNGSLAMNATEFFGLPVVSLGIHKIKEGGNYQELKILDRNSNLYKNIIIKDQRIVGAVLVGDINNSGVLLRLIKEEIEVSSFKDKLLSESFGYPDIMNFLKDKENIYV